MRGKVAISGKTDAALWITPAYAGKSDPVGSAMLSVEDHPRLCGEKNVKKKNALRGIGSPPPMRGKADVSVA